MTLDEVLKRTGLTYRQLDHWVRRGWLQPDRVESRSGRRGSGVARIWPPRELRIARIMGTLVQAGVEPAVAADTTRRMITDGTYPVAELGQGVAVIVGGVK